MKHDRSLILLLAMGSLLFGCSKLKPEEKTDPAASSAAPTPESPAGGAASPPDTAAKPATTAESPAPSGAKSPTTGLAAAPSTTITNGQKQVKTDGKDLQLKNETGKGGITTSGGTTTVTGKSGKSVNIPMP